ncbi:MAG: hypothetical protein M3071_15560 [Actinomycetota bacterium]|nr:hypothetical protein [Actinomycetota bacterium]
MHAGESPNAGSQAGPGGALVASGVDAYAASAPDVARLLAAMPYLPLNFASQGVYPPRS